MPKFIYENSLEILQGLQLIHKYYVFYNSLIHCINRIDQLETLCHWTDIYVWLFFLISHVLEHFWAMRISESLQYVLRDNFMPTFSARTLCPPCGVNAHPAQLSSRRCLSWAYTSPAHICSIILPEGRNITGSSILKSLDLFRHLNVCPTTQLLPFRLENVIFYSKSTDSSWTLQISSTKKLALPRPYTGYPTSSAFSPSPKK